MFASKSERKVRYSIRKFSIGVASVVVASLFLGGVVHAQGVGGGNSPMVTSSGQDRLKEYRQQLIKELEDTDLSSDRKADYRKQIEDGKDYSTLASVQNQFYDEARTIRETKRNEAVVQAKLLLSKYMGHRLDELTKLTKQDNSKIGEIVEGVKSIVLKYQSMFDGAYDEAEVEQLRQKGQSELDKLVEDFKNSLSNQQSEPSGNSNSSNGRGDTTKPANQGLDSDSPSGKEHNNPTPPKVENQGGNIVSTEKTTETNLKEAKETAKTTLSAYRLTRLKQENGGVFWFTDLLRESKESVEKYIRMFDEASSKEKVENLVKEAEQEIEDLVVKHKGREIGLERNKAKEAVTKHLTGLLDDIKKNLEKEQHINTVELIKKLKDIEKTYLHKLDESTQKAQLQDLVTESQSKLDEALSNFKKGLSSSSNSESSTKPETPEKSEEPAPSKPAEPEVGNQSDKPAPSLSDTKEVQDLIKKGFQELEKLEKSLQELNEKAELPDEEFYGKQKTIWDDQKSTIQKSIKDFKDIVKDIASQYHKENYFKKYNSDFKDYQLYVQMEIMTRQVRDYLLRYPKDGDIIKEFESGMKQTASDNYSNLSGDNLKGYFEKNFRSAFEKIQEIVRKLEKKAPAPKTPEKSEQPTPSKPAEKEQNPSGTTAGSHSGSTSSSGSSSASTKPETPEKSEQPTPSKPAEKEQNPSGSTTGSHSGSASSSGSSSAPTKPKSPEKPERPAPSKPAERELNPSGSATGRHSDSTSSSGSSSASTKPKSPEKPEEPTPSKPSGNETNSSSPTRSNSLSPTLSSQPTSTVQKVFMTEQGNTKITVMFETATEADSVNLKEVTTKEMVDNVIRQTGQGTVRIFDISLSKDGKETHVKGERVVRLAIGNIDSEIQVYHVKENGELELLPSTVENGQVVFKTSHFSLFAIKTLPKKQMATEPEANREGKTQSDDKEMVLLADKANQMSENRSNSDKKDKQALPSTGTMSTLLMEFLGLISLVGVYLLKGKKTEND
ncbi:GAG-binding domain-containing protein [Streptococcus mitis]|uniref:GAG-binding domain-containing protein n=1 Tax=Streptococcus mitis TaxID=28037 RepID=UPI001C4ED07E